MRANRLILVPVLACAVLAAGHSGVDAVNDDLPERSGQPQRIVALDPFTFEAMVALNAPMVATPGVYINEFLAKFPEYADRFESMERLTSPPEVEQLIVVEPDAILCRESACGRSVRRYRRIAPTVVFENESSADWQVSSRFMAEAIGMAEEHQRIEDHYRKRVATFREALERRFGDNRPTVSTLRVMPGRLRLYFDESFAGVVLSDIGLERPAAQRALADGLSGGPRLYNLSLEELRLVDADFVFVYVTNLLSPGEATNHLEEVRNNDLWSTLSAVRNGTLHVVENNWFAAGYIAANAIIDDLYRLVLGDEPPER